VDHISGEQVKGGERQLVLIARALAQKTRILVMDEPTASLDYGNQFRIMQKIKKLAKDGYLVVLSTHNPEHALLYADKALVLKDGEVEVFGEPFSALTPKMIEKIYGISVELKEVHTSRGAVPVFVPNFENIAEKQR